MIKFLTGAAAGAVTFAVSAWLWVLRQEQKKTPTTAATAATTATSRE